MINRKIKSIDNGNEELFVEYIFDTELGKIPYGKWIKEQGCHNYSDEQIINIMNTFKDDAIVFKEKEIELEAESESLFLQKTQNKV